MRKKINLFLLFAFSLLLSQPLIGCLQELPTKKVLDTHKTKLSLPKATVKRKVYRSKRSSCLSYERLSLKSNSLSFAVMNKCGKKLNCRAVIYYVCPELKHVVRSTSIELGELQASKKTPSKLKKLQGCTKQPVIKSNYVSCN